MRVCCRSVVKRLRFSADCSANADDIIDLLDLVVLNSSRIRFCEVCPRLDVSVYKSNSQLVAYCQLRFFTMKGSFELFIFYLLSRVPELLNVR